MNLLPVFRSGLVHPDRSRAMISNAGQQKKRHRQQQQVPRDCIQMKGILHETTDLAVELRRFPLTSGSRALEL